MYGTVQQPFIVSESGHSWGEPQPIPGIASVSSSGAGDNGRPNEVTSVSCPDASDCVVAGILFPQLNSDGLFFTLDEAGGTWGQAKALSLPSGDSVDGPAPVVSCRSAGNCVIAAKVANLPGQSSSGSSAVVTAAESSSGAWGAATAIPGIAAGDWPRVDHLACVPGGDCTVLGLYYPGGNNPNEIFSATSPDGGVMGAAQQVASSGIISPTTQLACPRSGHCIVTYDGVDAIVGQPNTYDGPTSPQQITEVAVSTVTLTASAPKAFYGDEAVETLTATVASPSGGTPTGKVTVRSGSATVCSITLTNETGRCTLPVTALPSGTDQLTATYSGDVSYATATSTVTITVVKPTYSGTIRLPKMGVCLDDRGNNARNGAIVEVWRCNGLVNQQWQVFSDGTIRHNSLCLDATGGRTANGTKVDLWACNGGANQKWDTKNWRIHYDNPAAVNKVLDDTGFGGNGTQQEIWTNTGGANQYWTTT
jgi:hypothetical protein